MDRPIASPAVVGVAVAETNPLITASACDDIAWRWQLGW